MKLKLYGNNFVQTEICLSVSTVIYLLKGVAAILFFLFCKFNSFAFNIHIHTPSCSVSCLAFLHQPISIPFVEPIKSDSLPLG